MQLNEYQDLCKTTAIYPDRGNNLTYPTLGLAGEAGEVAEAIKKLMRDHNGVLTAEYTHKIAKELGDVLWYVAILADELGCSLESIAQLNLHKLANRKLNNQLHGEGSDR